MTGDGHSGDAKVPGATGDEGLRGRGNVRSVSGHAVGLRAIPAADGIAMRGASDNYCGHSWLCPGAAKGPSKANGVPVTGVPC